MYDGKLTKVSDMDALAKMNYMSDMYFQDMVGRMEPDGTWKPAPNNAEARKFRRSLAKEMGLSGDEARAFIEGDVESMMSTNTGKANFAEAQRHWREVTRQSFVKPSYTTRSVGSGTKPPKEPEFIRNRYVVNLATLRQEELDLAGVEGPVEIAEINGDGLEKPIEVIASTEFEAEGIPTEKANYKIYGAAFWPHTDANGNQLSTFIARVQIPVIASEYDPETETYTEKVVYESRDVVVGHKSTGWRKEIYNNLLNNSSDLSLAMAAKYSNWADRVIEEEGVVRPL